MSDNISSKQYLTDVAIIRPILIVLLVFYHAFAIYSGAWEPIKGYPEVPVYWWLDKLSYAFMLETFVFVSGYVFGYQVKRNGESKLEVPSLFLGKLKRLVIPSIIFSLLYIIIFNDITQPITKTLYEVIGGCAHMWFLPMLFWCFIGIWVIERLHLKPRFVFPMLFLGSLVSFVPLPLRLSNTLYYMFFFYAGYSIWRNNISFAKYTKIKYLILAVLAFVILFPTLTIIKENLGDVIMAKKGYMLGGHTMEAIIIAISKKLATIIYSTIGLVMLFILVGYYNNKQSTPLPQKLIEMGGLCMGVYLLQQFILKALYDFTPLPNILGPIWLPWICFVITLIVSIVLSYILRLTKIGRFLIG